MSAVGPVLDAAFFARLVAAGVASHFLGWGYFSHLGRDWYYGIKGGSPPKEKDDKPAEQPKGSLLPLEFASV